MAVDLNALSRNEQGALVAGTAAILLSFVSSYLRVELEGSDAIPGFDVSAGSSAWTSYATLGILLVIVATVVVAIKAFSAQALPADVPWNFVALVTAGLGTVLLILRALTAGGDAPGVSVGPGWSGWLLFLAVIALTIFTALAFRESGEQVPEVRRDTPPAA